MDNIATTNLSYAYGEGELKRQVLNNININIKRGEIVIMTGPSGSGKTTLLTILGGLRLAHHGQVNVVGRELVNSAEETRLSVRRQTGYIFQHHNLLPQLTALQNVCMALELDNDTDEATRQKQALHMLDQVGLKDRADYFITQLSGGQRQRVSIARALVHKPQLVLADEPTASLDKQNGQEAVSILKELAKEHETTILLVTHDYRILDMADRVLHLEDGVLRLPHKRRLTDRFTDSAS